MFRVGGLNKNIILDFPSTFQIIKVGGLVNKALPGGGGGVPVQIGLCPCSSKIENVFSYVPCSLILSLFPCSPQNLTFVPLFP